MMSKFNIKIELDKDDVIEAIVEYVNSSNNSQVLCAPNDVSLEVEMLYEDRPCGSPYPVFKKAVVQVNKL